MEKEILVEKEVEEEVEEIHIDENGNKIVVKKKIMVKKKSPRKSTRRSNQNQKNGLRQRIYRRI